MGVYVCQKVEKCNVLGWEIEIEGGGIHSGATIYFMTMIQPVQKRQVSLV